MKKSCGPLDTVKVEEDNEEAWPSSSVVVNTEISINLPSVKNSLVGIANGDENTPWANMPIYSRKRVSWMMEQMSMELKENQRLISEILHTLRSVVINQTFPVSKNGLPFGSKESQPSDPEEGKQAENTEIHRKSYVFPLKTLKALDEVEEILKVDMNYIYLINGKLFDFPCDSCRIYTTKILNSFISKELAIEFTFTGKKSIIGLTLRSFESLRLFSVIKSKILMKFPDVEEITVDVAIREWIGRCRRSVSDKYAKELTAGIDSA